MSHLPALSDFIGTKRQQSSVRVVESAAKSNVAELVSEEKRLRNLFTGMSRSLSHTSARIARNKKVNLNLGSCIKL